ncbi:MAG: hypothetical protein R2911_45815 [Caldilineaceae bacterium]
MIGLPVQAGDAILFTENLRHGRRSQSLYAGAQNAAYRLRHWMMSQKTSSMDEPPFLTDATAPLSQRKTSLFRAWPV